MAAPFERNTVPSSLWTGDHREAHTFDLTELGHIENH